MPHDFNLQELEERLQGEAYVTERAISMALFLALRLQKPLLIEGPAGVGKTEIAKVLAKLLNTELIRLQCYDGIEASQALFEWNYQHQLMYLKMQEIRGGRFRMILNQSCMISDFYLRGPFYGRYLQIKGLFF